MTETSGAIPNTTELREAPARSIAFVTNSCPTPGCSSPASRNGHAAPAWMPRDGASTAAARTHDDERARDRGHGRQLRIRMLPEPDPEPDAHRPEEERRQQREPDRSHARDATRR